jgi:hypothetical protein
MTIKQIFDDTNLISVRTYNICCDNGFDTVADIYRYKVQENDFFRLKKCGAKTNFELNELLIKYKSDIYDIGNDAKKLILEEHNNLTVDDLYSGHQINIISLNFCKANKFYTLIDLIEFYKNNNNFLAFPNCSNNSNDDLVKVCDRYIAIFESTNLELNFNYFNTIQSFNRIQREVLNNFISIAFNQFSPRSQNALSGFLNNDITILNISNKLLRASNFDFNRIQNVGAKSLIELDFFLNSLKKFINSLSEIRNEDEISKLVYKYIFKNVFINIEIPDEVLSTSSLLKILEYLILNGAIYNTDYENYILQYGINIFNNNDILTTDEVSEELGISRERVRQIREKITNELINKFGFIKAISKNVEFFYRIDLEANVVNLNDNIISNINNENKTNFSKIFITLLVYINYQENFNAYGVIGDSLYYRGVTPKNRHIWNSIYLIKSTIYLSFKFDEFFDDIYLRSNKKIKETYTKNIKSYISNFTIIKDYKLIPEIIDVVESILTNEFQLIIDLNDNLIFEKNTLKLKGDYILEALEFLGKPSRINEIFDFIDRKYPNIFNNVDAIRGQIPKIDEIIFFGKKSTYGLRKWESNENLITGGTIKDIVLRYLNTKDNPIHISEILDQLTNYRFNTNAKNVITNLKLDPNKQFVFFHQSFIGLKSKKYGSILTRLPMFMGRRIVNYIKQNPGIEVEIATEYLAKFYYISEKNMMYIIRQLVENKNLSIINNKINKV